MKIRNLIKILSLNVLLLAALVMLIEFGFRLISETHSNQKAFRLTQPPPYQTAPFFSTEFINESFNQGGWEVSPDSKLIFPKDFRGKYFTVENRHRRTTDIPPDASRIIYLFGGSTVYNATVPDEYTIASHLQRKLVGSGYTDYQVINVGVTSVNTIQQVERLKMIELSSKDIVIFYDGVNDVIQGVLYGNSGSTMVSSDRSRPLWQKLFSKIANHSVIIRQSLTKMARNYRIYNLESRVNETVTRYRKNIDTAEKIVSAQGASFLHFLQPNLYTLAEKGDYEERLLTLEIVPLQAENAFLSTYPHFERVVEARSRQGYAEHNLTSVLDTLEKPVYLDFCHVNHVATESIAAAIFEALSRLDVQQAES